MIVLSDDQQAAVDKFAEFILDDFPGELAIEGHAGTGKSILTRELIDLTYKLKNASKLLKQEANIFEKESDNIVLCATTNKAARVLGNFNTREARTIHSFLGLKVYTNYNTGATSIRKTRESKPVRNTLIIIDEASMIDKTLLNIIRELCIDCKVVFILDPYQLAPIGYNSCPVATEVHNKAILTQIQRQALGNPIIALAEKFRKVLDGGSIPSIIGNGKELMTVDGKRFQQLIQAEFNSVGHDIDSGKIVCWTNDRVNEYNTFVRKQFTPHSKFEVGEILITNNPIASNKGATLFTTDSPVKIASIDTDANYFNGVSNWVVTFETSSDIQCRIPVDPKELKRELGKLSRKAKKEGNWMPYYALKEAFVDLRPPHCSTIHKSQGSTHKKVFIDLGDIGRNSNHMEFARLMYVALTRASEQVIIYGQLPSKYSI